MCGRGLRFSCRRTRCWSGGAGSQELLTSVSYGSHALSQVLLVMNWLRLLVFRKGLLHA